jgi:acetyl esterase/lipase
MTIMSRLSVSVNKPLLSLCITLLLLGPCAAAELPKGVTLRRDIAYGADPAQRIDVYLPPQSVRAPILFMVHGGGWRRGDKDNPGVTDNKVARWIPKGIIFVSVDYRMMPEAEPLTQAEDVARALAKVQELAPGWGGDPANIILVGHSAGAHLVAVVTAAPAIAAGQGAKPWKGSVLLDSGAMDVPAIMNAPHWPLYDKAFAATRRNGRRRRPSIVLPARRCRCSRSVENAATRLPSRPGSSVVTSTSCRWPSPTAKSTCSWALRRLYGPRGGLHAGTGLEALTRVGRAAARDRRNGPDAWCFLPGKFSLTLIVGSSYNVPDAGM